MLKQRIITGVVIVIGFFAALFGLSPLHYSLLVGIVAVYASWEWSNLAGLTSPVARLAFVVAAALAMVVLAQALGLWAGAIDSAVVMQVMISAGIWWAIALLWVQGYPSSAVLWGSSWVTMLMGLLVLVPTWGAMTALIFQDSGRWLVLLVVVVVGCADTGAFFAGKKFGRRKLAPQVSPGKTVEGLAGGLLTNLVLVVILGLSLSLPFAEWWRWLLVIAATSFASVLGDLLESMVKRHRGVKDSGNILPGHGGVLDRIDSLSAALPIFTLTHSLLLAQ